MSATQSISDSTQRAVAPANESDARGARHSARVMVVEDEPNARRALTALLESDGYDSVGVESAEDALAELDGFPAEVFLVDVRLPGMSGLDLISEVRARIPEAICIVMTAFSSVESAVTAMQRGAEDYLIKPVNPDELDLIIQRELRHRAVALEAKRLREEIAAHAGVPGLIGVSGEMRDLHARIAQAAPSRASVIITGESGTGKELIARALHELSPRCDGPFVAVNCAAIPETLIESELFGHEKGAFTGAIAQRKGRFELADAGTLFLDEIGEISLSMQVKLLRALQERAFERVGGTSTVTVDVRVIAATNLDLDEQVRNGRFRDDLFYRLNVVALAAPALRTHRTDIPVLWEHFVRRYEEQEGRERLTTTPEVLLALFAYDWPGNVRELENVAEHGVVMCRGSEIGVEHLPTRMGGGNPKDDPTAIRVPGMTMEEIERAAILRTYELVNGSTRKTAEALGLSVRKVQYRLREYREGGLLPPAD